MNCIGTFFFPSAIKYSKKSNLREEGLFWVTVQGYKTSRQGIQGNDSWKWLITLCLQSTQLTFFIYSFRDPSPENSVTHSGMAFYLN